MSQRDDAIAQGVAKFAADALTDDPDVQPCMSRPIIYFDAYRIGVGPHRPHWAHRFHVDRWFRSWQCEWETIYGTFVDGCMAAPRSWTKRGAIRKGHRWYRSGTDVGRSRRRRMRIEEQTP